MHEPSDSLKQAASVADLAPRGFDGNSHHCDDDGGALVRPCGPHIFPPTSADIFETLATASQDEAESDALHNVSFLGRVATCKHHMDQLVGQSLAAFERIRQTHGEPLDCTASSRVNVPPLSAAL